MFRVDSNKIQRIVCTEILISIEGCLHIQRNVAVCTGGTCIPVLQSRNFLEKVLLFKV